MCRGLRDGRYCSLLGGAAAGWSRETTLPKPGGAEALLDPVVDAWRALEVGDGARACALLAGHDDSVLRDWFVEHAQVSGGSRFRALGRRASPAPQPNPTAKGFAHLAEEVMRRDGYHCRYCGSRVAPAALFRRVAAGCGPDAFAIGRTNATRPGVWFTACASLDHVKPYALGGPTEPDNLVTTCWGCNYGKWNYTLEQIGLDDPFARPPVGDAAWTAEMERARRWRPPRAGRA